MSSKRLESVFMRALALQPPVEFGSLAYRSTRKWDSVAHMQLVAELENEFGVMLETDDVIGLSSFPKAIEILRKYGVDANAA